MHPRRRREACRERELQSDGWTVSMPSYKRWESKILAKPCAKERGATSGDYVRV